MRERERELRNCVLLFDLMMIILHEMFCQYSKFKENSILFKENSVLSQ